MVTISTIARPSSVGLIFYVIVVIAQFCSVQDMLSRDAWMQLMATNEDANEGADAEPLAYWIQNHDDTRKNKRPALYLSPIRTFQDHGSSSDERDGRSKGRTKLAKITNNDHRPRPASQAQKEPGMFWHNDARPSPVSQAQDEPETPQRQPADGGSPAVHQDDSSPSPSSSDEPASPEEYQQPFPSQQPQVLVVYTPHAFMDPHAAHGHDPGVYGFPRHGGPQPLPPTMPPSYHYPHANGGFVPHMHYPRHPGPYMPHPYMPLPMNPSQMPANFRESHNRAYYPGAHSRVRPPIMLYTPNDDEILSDYQIFVRKQIEFFEANTYDVETPQPGRKKPIILRQVGIRCKHCRDIPIARRKAASVYFPSNLRVLYQAAQNIACNHLDKCPNMSQPLKRAYSAFQQDGKRPSAGHGGRQYWADAARALGVVESQDRLRFRE